MKAACGKTVKLMSPCANAKDKVRESQTGTQGVFEGAQKKKGP
jgi:hypothetical protein